MLDAQHAHVRATSRACAAESLLPPRPSMTLGVHAQELGCSAAACRIGSFGLCLACWTIWLGWLISLFVGALSRVCVCAFLALCPNHARMRQQDALRKQAAVAAVCTTAGLQSCNSRSLCVSLCSSGRISSFTRSERLRQRNARRQPAGRQHCPDTRAGREVQHVLSQLRCGVQIKSVA